MLQGLFHALNREISCCTVAFQQCQDFPARIINNSKNIRCTVIMPINVHSRQAVPSLIPYPVFLPYVLLCFPLGKTKREHYLVNPVMSDVLTIIPLNER